MIWELEGRFPQKGKEKKINNYTYIIKNMTLQLRYFVQSLSNTETS